MITKQMVSIKLKTDGEQLTGKEHKKVKCSHKEQKRNIMSQLEY